MSTRAYSLLALLVLLILGFLLFLGPEIRKEPEKEKAKLWEVDWQIIEYYPEGVRGDSKNLKFRFLRQSTLQRDLYHIEASLQNKKDSGLSYPKRNGNHFVKNIFSNWYKPNLLAYYKLADSWKGGEKLGLEKEKKEKSVSIKKKSLDHKRKEKGKEKKFVEPKEVGIEDSSPRIFFYKSRDTSGEQPFILTIGKHLPNRRILVHLNQEPDLILALPKNLFSTFDKPALAFRSKEILHFPAKGYIKSIELHLKNTKLRLEQIRKKEEKSMNFYWSLEDLDKKEGKEEFSRELGIALGNDLKQLKISHFEDEKKVQKFPPSYKLWQTAKKDFLKLKIEIARGKTSHIFIRKPRIKIKVANKKNLALLRSSQNEFTDFIDIKKLEAFLEKLENIEKFIKEKKEMEKRKKEAANKKDKKSKPLKP